MEDTRQNVYISLTARHEEEYEEEEGETQDVSEGYSDLSQSPPSTEQLRNGSLHFKPFDSGEQSSHSSSLSNTVDIPSSSRLLEEEESVYQPLSPFSSPFELELQKGPQTPVGSQPETPSPLEHSKTFPGMRPRKSSSLSNVLDDTSYCTEPPTDTISNTSNPQVHAEHPGCVRNHPHTLFKGTDICAGVQNHSGLYLVHSFNPCCTLFKIKCTTYVHSTANC